MPKCRSGCALAERGTTGRPTRAGSVFAEIASPDIFAYDAAMPPEAHRSYYWPPKIQVAGVSTLEEALFCKSVGVDAIGFTLGLPDGPHDDLTPEKARTIVCQLPPGLLPVVITYVNRADAACELAVTTSAAAMQFHGGISEEELVLFRRICPNVRTIGRVTVSGEKSIEDSASLTPPLRDAIILDSLDPRSGRKGATGLTHDWSISAKIVRIASVPVILAGGLNPDNVADAIRKVRPHGVDAHTGLEDENGTRSFDKIKAFAELKL
jgi:phosphoribosylanthranilate isomerase